ncbi:MAG: hypothetical protein LBD60_05075 [Puniceicoccales bacterium]|jgi:hypothetical protein|nr:hypothetical protein [Puniceicoccales bacterium]
MKNMNQLKVMLPLILGFSGIVQGSSGDDLRNDVGVGPSSVFMHPAEQVPVPEERQVYLIYDAGRDWLIFESKRFVFLNGKGDPIFFPEIELADFLHAAKCVALPRCLFKRIASKEVCSSMEATYGNSEIGDEIRRRANRIKSRLFNKARKGEPFMILMEEGRANGGPFLMVDCQTEKSYRSILGGVDMKAIYRVEVSKTLYKKLITRTLGQKIGLVYQVILDTSKTTSATLAVAALVGIGIEGLYLYFFS